MLSQYDRDFLTVKEVAKELGSDEQTVRYRLRDGVMPGIKIGSRWYVAKDWLTTPNNQGIKNAQTI